MKFYLHTLSCCKLSSGKGKTCAFQREKKKSHSSISNQPYCRRLDLDSLESWNHFNNPSPVDL